MHNTERLCGFLCGTLRTSLVALFACVLASGAWAQNFPTKPLRIVVPYAATGGAADFISRLIAQKMGPDLGQSMVVENRGGGAFIPAINLVLSAPPDGHTLFLSDSGQWAINPALRSVPYDYVREFVPVGLVFTAPLLFVVNSSTPLSTMQDLTAMLAKAKPGTINYASPGIGSLHHLANEIFANSLGVKLNNIPYKGGGDMVEAVLRGDVQYALAGVASILPQVKAGKVRMLALTTKSRFSLIPDVPSASEVIPALRDYDISAQTSVVVRAGTPKPVIDRLSASLRKTLAQPDIIAKAFEFGLDITPSTPERLGEIIQSDMREFAAVVKASGMKLPD